MVKFLNYGTLTIFLQTDAQYHRIKTANLFADIYAGLLLFLVPS